uniref:Uncharacterized protein n=1 Tax=Oryzias sinensis TaxID=183150 RepID=A0A8C7Y817_9TELE
MQCLRLKGPSQIFLSGNLLFLIDSFFDVFVFLASKFNQIFPFAFFQRRNWTPQAILYLKGAQGHRSLLEHSSREERGISRSGLSSFFAANRFNIY